MWWRANLIDPDERLATYTGLAHDHDGPVAMFTLVSGRPVPLRMSDLGELCEMHSKLLRAEIPAHKKDWVVDERDVALTGAFALHTERQVPYDERLDPQVLADFLRQQPDQDGAKACKKVLRQIRHMGRGVKPRAQS